MAYNDEAVKAKLSTLNETQESIVTVAQWIMFHRRHADRTATLWLERMKDSNAGKRLNLIYLANEVVQQSKARKRDDFLIAFSPFIPDAVAIAFRGASTDIRGKIKRVVEVWRQRGIFDDSIQNVAESRMKEIEASHSAGGKKLLGGSLFSGSSNPGPAVPAELRSLVPLQENVTKAESGSEHIVHQADSDAGDVSDAPATAIPLRIARFNKALKSLSQAESAVANSIKARRDLLEELERLVQSNRDALDEAENRLGAFEARSREIDSLKQQDEASLLRRLPADDEDSTLYRTNGSNVAQLDGQDFDAPDTEELTPPPIEDFTPVGSPETKPRPVAIEPSSWKSTNPLDSGAAWTMPLPEPGADLMASLSRPFSATDMGEDEAATKRQRLGASPRQAAVQGIPGLGDDLDELIKSEGGREQR